MKSMRLIPRTAFAQLFETRPLAVRDTFRQLERPFQQLSRTRPTTQHAPGRRTLHTGRRPNHDSAHSYRPNFTFGSSARRPANSTGAPRSGRGRRWNSSDTKAAGEEKLTLSQRLKKLSREYGWSAVGVYLALTALDFPFCFLAVRLLGTDRIGHWEHVIIETIKSWVKWPLPEAAQQQIENAGDLIEETIRVDGAQAQPGEGGKRLLEEDAKTSYKDGEVEDHGYKEAEKANKGPDASIWTQLALAYAIHKSFIFIRVPLTVSITPKVVKTLRSWGWNIGKAPTRKGIQSSASKTGSTGVNTKGSKVKPDD